MWADCDRIVLGNLSWPAMGETSSGKRVHDSRVPIERGKSRMARRCRLWSSSNAWAEPQGGDLATRTSRRCFQTMRSHAIQHFTPGCAVQFHDAPERAARPHALRVLGGRVRRSRRRQSDGQPDAVDANLSDRETSQAGGSEFGAVADQTLSPPEREAGRGRSAVPGPGGRTATVTAPILTSSGASARRPTSRAEQSVPRPSEGA